MSFAKVARRSFLASVMALGVFGVGAGRAQAVEIQYWQYVFDTRVQAMTELIKQFEAANPDITVKQVTFPYADYQTRLIAAKAAGRGPEVMQLFYGWLDTFIAGKLGYAGWPTWPPDERKAVLGLFAEAWRAGLWRHPDEVDSSGWIAAIALLGGDLDGALAAWLSTPSPNAALHLAAFFQGEAESLIRKPRNVAYWGNVDDDTIDRMQRWLRGEEPRQLLLNARGLAEPKDEWLLDSALLVVNAVTP